MESLTSMNTTLLDLFGLAAVPILVLINAFFVAAEFSIVAVRRTRLQEMVEAGKVGARAAQQVTDNLNSALAAAQLGITLASLALGWIGEPALAHLIRDALDLLPGNWQAVVAHSIALTVAL